MASAGRPRRPPGPGPETAKRELFLRLIGQGLTNSAACRQAGVHRRTGTRWRYGRRAVDVAGRTYEYPSIMRPAPTLSDRFLRPGERLVIGDQLRTGMSLRAIARGLGRSPSTVSREGAAALRTGRTRRKPHRTTTARNARFDSMVNISERPAEVADRAVAGHWEGDLIIGAGNGSANGTLVERTTRFVVLLHLPQGRTAEAVRDSVVAGVSTLPDLLRRSLT